MCTSAPLETKGHLCEPLCQPHVEASHSITFDSFSIMIVFSVPGAEMVQPPLQFLVVLCGENQLLSIVLTRLIQAPPLSALQPVE